MIVVLRIFLLSVIVIASGCASTPASRPSGSSGDAAVDALYRALDAQVVRYQSGLDAARSGDPSGAQATMKAALDQMRSLTLRCSQQSACDSQRFYAAFDRLLRLNVGDLAAETAVGAVAAPASTVEPVEGSPVLATLPEMGRTITLLKGRELSEVIAVNGAVKNGIQQWLTQYRPNLMTTWVNYQYLRYRMWPEYHRAGLPEAILFGIMAKESGGRVHAVSRSGAAGLLQFMPATGARFGMTVVDGFDQRYDAARSARANAAYVNEQLGALNNNLELVLAAYNGGEGRMRRIAAGSPQASFWDPQIYAALPPETRDYVPMVLAAAWLFLHPDRYNLEFPKIDGRPGRIKLAQAASLAELTVCFGQVAGNNDGWFRTLRNLNPGYEHDRRIPVGTTLDVPFQLELAYPKHCAKGPWQVLASDLQTAVPPPQPVASAQPPAARAVASAKAKPVAAKQHVVRKGDTLASIGRRTGCSTGAIASANGLRPPHYGIRVGQTLKLPACAR